MTNYSILRLIATAVALASALITRFPLVCVAQIGNQAPQQRPGHYNHTGMMGGAHGHHGMSHHGMGHGAHHSGNHTGSRHSHSVCPLLERFGTHCSAYNLTTFCATRNKNGAVSCIGTGGGKRVTEKCYKVNCKTGTNCTSIYTTCCVNNNVNLPKKCVVAKGHGKGGGMGSGRPGQQLPGH